MNESMIVIGVIASARGAFELETGGVGEAPAAAYCRTQRACIPLTVEHEETLTVGEVVRLERASWGAGPLYAVARADRGGLAGLELDEQPWYFSPVITGKRGAARDEMTNVRIEEVALTRAPSSFGLSAVTFVDGALGERRPRGLSILLDDILAAARYDIAHRRRWDPLVIYGADEPTTSTAPVKLVAAPPRPLVRHFADAQIRWID